MTEKNYINYNVINNSWLKIDESENWKLKLDQFCRGIGTHNNFSSFFHLRFFLNELLKKISSRLFPVFEYKLISCFSTLYISN